MKYIYYRIVLALALGALSPVSAEICSDVLNAIHSKQLDVRVQGHLPWYIPGEMVVFKMVFENKTLKPLLIPSDKSSFNGFVYFLIFAKTREVPDGYWESPGGGFPKELGWKPCEATSNPRVLLPGDRFEYELYDLEGWRNGTTRDGRIEWSPGTKPGTYKIQYEAAELTIRGDLEVRPIDSRETRWISSPSADGTSTRLRKALLVRSGGDSVLLLATYLNPSIPVAKLGDYLEYEMASSRIRPENANSMERIFLAPGELSFRGRESQVLSDDQEIQLWSNGSVVRTIDTRLHRVRVEPKQ